MLTLRKKLLLAGLATLGALAVAEIGLRLFVDQEVKRLAIYDRELGWRGRPQGRGVYVRSQDGIRVPFRYNNLGFNDDDITPKPPGGQRVAMLGDSFVESLEVPAEAVFHQLVEQQLKKVVGPDADVVAICSQGYSTAQELLAFRKFKDDVEADIVLLIFYAGNDFEDNLRTQFAFLDKDGQLVLPENQDSWLRARYLSWKRWLYESSHLVFVTKNVLESYAALQLGDSAKATVPADEAQKLEITTQLLRKCKQEVEAAGREFGVVVIPEVAELRGDTKQKRSDLITMYCEGAGITCLDLSTILTPEDYFEVDVHFRESGHRKSAAAILDFLIADFGLTQSTPTE